MSFSNAFLFALLAAAPALHASTITYDMTFTSGSSNGTGTFTLAAPPAGSGPSSYTEASQQLQNLTFTLDGQTYDFSSDPSASVQFNNGQISQINFGQAFSPASDGYTLILGSGFSLYGSNDQTQPVFSGSYNVTYDSIPGSLGTTDPAPTPTPEPGSLTLLGTALLAGGFLVLRRNRAAHS